MNYATMRLEITAAEARDIIAERVDGVRIREFHGHYEFRSPSGIHLAELSDLTLPDGDRGAQLKYRTAVISPVAALARSKAWQIKRAVEQHRYR